MSKLKDNPQTIYLTCDRDTACRLDKFLADHSEPRLYSRTFIEKLISEGMVIVNQKPVRKSFLLQQGDVITIHLPEPAPSEIVAQDIPLDVMFEDEFLAIINKPAGLVVHPGFGNPDNTVANAIVHRYGENLTDSDSTRRPGIVHRLDKDTSGLMVIAKDDKTQSLLSGQFSQRQVKKTYLAITTGVPDPPQDTIETFIARSVSNPRKMTVAASGREAVTHYRVIQFYHCFALLEINLETGRMHQIRVHLAHRHTPVLSDRLYNSLKNICNFVPENMKKKTTELLSHHLTRQALHAWKLQFFHPLTAQELAFTAPLPQDFVYTLDWLEKYFAIDNERYENKLLVK